MNYIEKIEEFNRTFNQPIPKEPGFPSRKQCLLRVRLLQEELDELKQAIEDKDLVEVADALCDIQYILSGAVIDFGMQAKFERMFNNVHQSNMSKTCKNKEEVSDTMESYDKKGVPTYAITHRGKWIIYRELDNKVLKSINYHPANLKPILEGFKVECTSVPKMGVKHKDITIGNTYLADFKNVRTYALKDDTGQKNCYDCEHFKII